MRKAARDGQQAQLRKRIGQLQEEVRGFRAQESAKGRKREIISKELEGVRELYRKNLIQVTRLNALERGRQPRRSAWAAHRIDGPGRGRDGRNRTAAAPARSGPADGDAGLGEIRAKVAELTERRTAAEDQVRRVEIELPRRVTSLATHTVGGVIDAAGRSCRSFPRATS